MMNFNVLSVSQLNRYLKDLLSLDDLLSGVWIRGEASNVTRHASGHLYFSLKDADAQISCAMWKPDAMRLRFPVESGAQYLSYGRLTVWEKRGNLQFVAEHLEPDGLGALHVAYERLKARLSAEGLFDESRKRPLPFLPRRVGLVTSLTGAAIFDMVRILRERHSRLDIVLIPARVQGEGAPESLAAAIVLSRTVRDLDVLIVGRGGGSLEDLWAFNDERVVRAIAECPIPVISAVGHETDVTLADFAADLRAPTPTAAAQCATPLREELRDQVLALTSAAHASIRRRLAEERLRVERTLDRAVFLHPLEMTLRRRRELEALKARLEGAGKEIINSRRPLLSFSAGRLEALSPLGVLARGYAIVESGDKILHSVQQVFPGEGIDVRLRDGRLDCKVMDITPDNSRPTET